MENLLPFFVRIELKIERFLNLCYLIVRQKLREIYKIVCGGLK